MTEEILINVTPQETRVAVMQQGVVQELHIERGSQRGLVSNVYVGKVKRVLPGMQSAFIDIGLERSAFLHVADIWENRPNGEGAAKPIEKVLFEGQSLLVQVIKDPIGTKGARLTSHISIPGRHLVFMPTVDHIGISRRIEKEGLVRLAFKYLYCEVYVVTGRPIREVPFDYEFANFAPEEASEARQAIAALRERLGEFADAVVAAPGDGLDALRRLGSTELTPAAFDRALAEMRALLLELRPAALVELRLTDLSPVGFWSVPSSQQMSGSDFGATPTLFKASIGGQAVPLVGALNKNGWYYALRRDALKKGPVWSAQFGRTNCPQCSDQNVAPSAFDGKTLYIGTGDTIPVSTYCAGSVQAVDPDAVVAAIAAGQKAAVSIDRVLGGKGLLPHDIGIAMAQARETSADTNGRAEEKMIPLSKRKRGFAEVVLGLDREQAICEASRCLRCDLERA